jgi:hypothetical protein
MMSKGKATLRALVMGVGSLPLGFVIGYFLVFVGLKTPANSSDGQAGLAEFLRLLYSVLMAGVSAIIVAAVAIWRLWPRRTVTEPTN